MIAAHWTCSAFGELPAQQSHGEAAAAGRCLPLAAELSVAAVGQLAEADAAPAAVLEMLRHTCVIGAYLLRAATLPALRAAAVGLHAMLGHDTRGHCHWLRDDLPFLSEEARRDLEQHLALRP